MTGSICLNADIGELPGADGRALDRAILGVVSRCSIACGGHAGDAESMAETLAMAASAGVRAGAHPSYPDRAGFGRARNDLSAADLEDSLISQVEALAVIAEEVGAALSHLKPHGALYNDAARDPELAGMVASVCRATGIAVLIGPPGSELQMAADRSVLGFIAEGFSDRAYERDGSLTPRSLPGAVFADAESQIRQALEIALTGIVTTRTGERIALPVRTLCLHGDTPGAAVNAARLRRALEENGVAVQA